MKKIALQFLTLNFVCFLFLEHSAYSAETITYETVSNAQEALSLIQGGNDNNAILISLVSSDQIMQKIIKINRGSKDEILQVAAGLNSRWTDATESGFGNIDFAQKPADMSFDDFMDECRWSKKINFFTDSGTYELSLHTKKKEIKLNGLKGKFTVKTLGDGSILILLGSDSLHAQKVFSVTL